MDLSKEKIFSGFTLKAVLAAVLISVPPVREAWQVGGFGMLLSLLVIVFIIFSVRYVVKNFQKSKRKNIYIALIIIFGLIILRIVSEPAIHSIEAVDPAKTGFLGGLGLPIISERCISDEETAPNMPHIIFYLWFVSFSI